MRIGPVPGGTNLQGTHNAAAHLSTVMSLVWFGEVLDMKKMWAGDCGMYLPLCKSCMTKFIKELPERNVYDHLHWQNLQEELRTTQEQVKGKGKMSQLQTLRAELNWNLLRSEMMEQQVRAIIAGLFQQQLRMMVKNARDSIKKEAKAEKEAKVAKGMCAGHMQLNDAGNTNEEKDDAGNTNEETDNAGNTDSEI
jgi:hypothetical protein